MRFLTLIMKIVALLFATLAFALLVQIDTTVLHISDSLFPGSGVWLCLVLVVAELLAILWLYRALFLRHAKLVLTRDASAEERQAFLAEMRHRLAHNSYVRAAGLSPDAPDFLERALAVLDAQAEIEIRSGGKKVFLGTALAQNGRLDALIVFFSLCRMVWRISAVYNQRPTPREIWSVYSTVSSATFLAFSLDALNIPQSIADALHELAPSVTPAMAASSVPFVGAAMHVFTTALIDGAANSLLAVRAGVITRRAYRHALFGGEDGLRSATVRETAAILLDISQEAIGAIVKAVQQEFQELSLNSGKKIVDNVGRVTTSVANTVTNAATSTADAINDGAQTVANSVVNGMANVSETVYKSGRSVADTTISGMQKAADNVKLHADSLGETARSVGDGVKNGMTHAGNAVGSVGKEVGKAWTALLDVLPGWHKKS